MRSRRATWTLFLSAQVVFAQRLFADEREEHGHQRALARDHLALAELGVAHQRAGAAGSAQAAVAAAAGSGRLLAEVGGEDAHAAHRRLAVAHHRLEALAVLAAARHVAADDAV